MAIAGIRGTGDWGTDERPKNFREMILWLKPNGSAPIHALTAKMGKETVNDPEFSWWEELLTIKRIQLNDGTAMVAGDTVFVVDNGVNGMTAQDLKPGDLLLVEQGALTTAYAWEIIRVTAITNATTFSAARGQAGTTAGAISDDAWMTLIGSAYGEGTVKAAATSRNPTKFANLTQIFKDTYELTKTAEATYARTGDIKKNDKKRKAFDHSLALEMAWLFGKKFETTDTNGKPLRYTGGLLYFLAAAGRTDVATAMTGATGINTMFDTIYDVFDYTSADGGGDERLVFCGNGVLNSINKAAAAAGDVQFGEVVKLYGMNLTRLVMPQGSFYFKTHPLLSRHPTFTDSMFIIEGSNIKYRPLAGRDTKTEDNIQTPGQDSTEGQWVTEAGLEFHFMTTMKFLSGVSYAP